jgi:hypothetical protein
MTPSNTSPDPVVCTSLPCLQQHEGQLIDIQGRYEFPKQQAFAVNRLRLEDGTTIVLPPAPEGGGGPFASPNDGKPMRLRGRIFTGPIPAKYHIIGRTPEPYLVDLEQVTMTE